MQEVPRSEKRDRRRELMIERHYNAMTALELERFLSDESALEESYDSYPTSNTPFNRLRKTVGDKKLAPILDRLEKAGLLFKKEAIEQVVKKYIHEKVNAERIELQIEDSLRLQNVSMAPENVGHLFFLLRTKKDPKGLVRMERKEGYFVITFYEDQDYLDFTALLPGPYEKSGGAFLHRALKYIPTTDDPSFSFDLQIIILRNGGPRSALEHERQHFMNHAIFDNFRHFSPTLPGSKYFPLTFEEIKDEKEKRGSDRMVNILNGVKDEVLARIRDGSNPEWTTQFLESGLYDYLRKDLSVLERQEVLLLLDKIKAALADAKALFDAHLDERAILVYHLIDIPLFKFPERIRAVTQFLTERINEFTSLVPDTFEEDATISDPKKSALGETRLEILGYAYHAADLVMGTRRTDPKDLEEELNQIKEKILSLREKYFSLARSGL